VEARPLRERRWGQLIVATYRCGRQADALRAYQRCRTVLADELGLEPGPELRRLEAAVLAQDPSLDWQPAATPPVPESTVAQRGRAEQQPAAQPAVPRPEGSRPGPSLVGRDAELAHLRGRLLDAASGHGGTVVLVGEPGAGKTTLAEGAAHLSTADLAQLAYHHLSAGPFGDVSKAVKYAREAAGLAARQGAWHDAVRHLEQALTAITPALPHADDTRCDVLVELGYARRSASMIREAHSALEESISLADRLGDEDRVLAAALAFGAPALWGSRDWGQTDTRLVGLLERQLDRIGDSDPARRVRILATLASELYFGQAAERGWSLANDALNAARQLGQPEELGIAVSAYMLSALSTDHLRQLRAVVNDMATSHQADLTPRVQIRRACTIRHRIRAGLAASHRRAAFGRAPGAAALRAGMPPLRGRRGRTRRRDPQARLPGDDQRDRPLGRTQPLR